MDNPEQLALLAGADAEILAEDERKGEFTGERLKRCRPEVYQAVLEGYAGGSSMRQLARLYHVSSNTVSAVIQSESAAIEALKKRIGRKATAVYALAFERLEEDLHNDDVMAKTSPKDKAVIVGILGDRNQVEAGLPSHIVEVRRVDASDVNDAFLDAIDVQAVEQSRKMGFGGALSQQKEGEFLPDLVADEAVDSSSDEGNRDSMSLVDDVPAVDSQEVTKDDA